MILDNLKACLWWGPILLLVLLTAGCEDLITMDIQDANPQYVIVGEINNREKRHEISINRTVSLFSPQISNPVSGAVVRVRDDLGRVIVFNEDGAGIYRSRTFRGQVGMSYTLLVDIDGMEFTANSTMPSLVPVDSVGTTLSSFMGENNRFVTFKFWDPPNKPNYYRYLLSINGEDLRYVSVFEDKFNDGKYVTHELLNFDFKIQPNDFVRIQRQFIDQATFQYWRSVYSANPAASAPANPPSNISNGALGYFSAHSILEYDVYIPQ